MLPTSHLAPMNSSRAATPEGALAEVFDAFMATAGRMEASYGQLQGEISRLRRELEQRNRALATSLAETRSIRMALHRILDALPCGVIAINRSDEAIGLINPEARRLVGTTASLALKDFPAQVRNAVRAAIGREDEHEVFLEVDGVKRWISVRKSTSQIEPEENARGEQAILILRDVTAHKQAEQQREASRNMVALGEMSSVLAHEIRNPLGSMELWTGLLAKQPDVSDESRHWLDHLQAGVRSLAATVNNVLQLHSRGTSNHIPLKLITVLQNGAAFVRPLAEQAGVKLSLEAELGAVEIAADANGLQQVILNLSINAFRHTAMGGALKIVARVSGKTAIVQFVDTGAGIPEADLARIFEPGFSGNGQTPGLGLTICRRIVEQHGGTIKVRSQVGKGTTFELEFPVL